MAKRKDGKETKQKLLDVACQVFAEKGFWEAKVTEICRRAEANVAAVNYYFGDKESLYVAAWRQTIERHITSQTLPPADLSPEERLRMAINQIIHKTMRLDEETSYFRRLELMELANPTGLIDETWNEMLMPRQKELLKMIRDLLGPSANEDDVKLCSMSIVNQCRGFILIQKSRMGDIQVQEVTEAMIDKISEHIYRFSLAGIEAIRTK